MRKCSCIIILDPPYLFDQSFDATALCFRKVRLQSVRAYDDYWLFLTFYLMPAVAAQRSTCNIMIMIMAVIQKGMFFNRG